MKRRQFFRRVSSLGLASFLTTRAVNRTVAADAAVPTSDGGSGANIAKIEFLRVTGTSGYRAFYVEATTEGNVKGRYGPLDAEAVIMADRFLKRDVLRKNVFETEAIWNDLYHKSRHSRGSHYLIGMSAIDNVLWDLKGRCVGLPVYKLLGGDRSQVQAYGSCLGFSLEPESLQAKARELENQGFVHQKWFLRDTRPEQGPQGLDQCVEKVRLLREALGDDADLMIDAFWQWDLPFAAAFAKRIEPYHVRWLEEPFQAVNLDAFIELSRETSVPIATGEHFYGRWDVQKFLERDAIRVVQADPEWCGGVSELVKICTLASVHGAHVIPHGHSLHAAMHVVASQPTDVCPLVEYLIRKMEGKWYELEKNPVRSTDGTLALPDRPGFGIELDGSKIAKIEPITWRDV